MSGARNRVSGRALRGSSAERDQIIPLLQQLAKQRWRTGEAGTSHNVFRDIDRRTSLEAPPDIAREFSGLANREITDAGKEKAAEAEAATAIKKAHALFCAIGGEFAMGELLMAAALEDALEPFELEDLTTELLGLLGWEVRIMSGARLRRFPPSCAARSPRRGGAELGPTPRSASPRRRGSISGMASSCWRRSGWRSRWASRARPLSRMLSRRTWLGSAGSNERLAQPGPGFSLLAGRPRHDRAGFR